MKRGRGKRENRTEEREKEERKRGKEEGEKWATVICCSICQLSMSMAEIDTAHSSSPVRLGVAGVGRLGEIHVRLAKETENAVLAGAFDTDPERVGRVAEQYGVKAFESLPDMLAEIDALCVVTPTTTHHAVAAAAMEAGVHCFIEKPIASTREEGEVLKRLAEERGLVLQVGHVERFNPAFLAVRDNSPEPVFIEAHRLAQFSPRATDVAVVLDLMIHDIDLVLALNGGQMPTEIRASGVPVVSDEIDIANARLEFPGGCVANLTASRISRNPMRKMRLFAPDSYIALDFAEPGVEVFSISDADGAGNASGMLGAIELGSRNRNISYNRPTVTRLNAIGEELRGFVNAVRTGAPPPVTADEGIAALAVAQAILEQIGGGK